MTELSIDVLCCGRFASKFQGRAAPSLYYYPLTRSSSGGASRSRAPLREAPASWGWLGAAASVLFSLSIVAKAGRWAVRRADTDQGAIIRLGTQISISESTRTAVRGIAPRAVKPGAADWVESSDNSFLHEAKLPKLRCQACQRASVVLSLVCRSLAHIGL